MAALYELTNDWLRLMELAEDPEVDLEVLDATLEGLDYEIEAKADGYAKVIQELAAEAEKLKKEIDRMTARKKTIENRIAHLRDNLKHAMELTGKEKFSTLLFGFNIQNNPPSLVIDNPEKIPKKFLIPQPAKPDNAAIKEMLKEKKGNKTPWAHLEVGRSLRIR